MSLFLLVLNIMEESNSKLGNEADSHKLLYQYQYAFLHMQKSFTSMFKVIRGFEQRSAYKHLRTWKFKCLGSYQSIKPHITLIKSTLKNTENKLKARYRINLLLYFNHLIKSSRIKLFHAQMKELYQTTRENNDKEVQVMEKEVKNLRKSQSELEIITKSYSKRETTLKNKLEAFNGKGTYEKLKTENKMLRHQLENIDKKVVFLFKDLNLLLDNLEDLKKKKLKRIKKKSRVSLKPKPLMQISS
jgi:predicted RNase H-like nuclease (RuvC/YqgF family)